MKNLKKILVGFLVLVLLVSSAVVLVVTAEEAAVQYTGDLSEAQNLFADVPTLPGTAADRCKVKLSRVYTYIKDNPIDPNTEGYKEFKAELERYTIMLADEYYDMLTKKVNNSAGIAEIQKALGVAISYVNDFEVEPGIADPDGDADEYMSSETLRNAIDDINYGIMKAFYDNAIAKSGAESPDYPVAMSELASLYEHAKTYRLFDEARKDFDAFYLDYNEKSIAIAKTIVDYLEGLEGKSNYYSEIDRLLPSLKEHIYEKCAVDFDAFEEAKRAELQNIYNGFKDSIEVFELGQIEAYYNEYLEFDKESSTAKFSELDEARAFSKAFNAFTAASVPEIGTEAYTKYSELKVNIEAVAARLNAVKEERRKELENKTPLYMYDFTNNQYLMDFTDSSQKMNQPNSDRDEYTERVETKDGNVYYRYVLLGEPDKHQVDPKETGYNNSSYASIDQPNITNGFVLSFDFMAEGANGLHYKKTNFRNEWGYYNAKGSWQRLQNYGEPVFTISYDAGTDSIAVSNRTVAGITGTTVTNIAAEGQWFNIMLAYDYNTHYAKLYIDYEYIFDVYLEGFVEGSLRTVFRCERERGSKDKWQYTSYDNITFYEGNYYRGEVNKFEAEGKTDAEKAELFMFLVESFMGDEYDYKSRKFAYDKAEEMLEEMKAYAADGQMTDDARETLDKSIKDFEDFDLEKELSDGIKAENLSEILPRIAVLKAYSITPDNIDQIKSQTEKLKELLETPGHISKADIRYADAVKELSKIEDNIEKIEHMIGFVKSLTQFTRATTLASMTKRYTAAQEIYNTAGYYDEETRKSVENEALFVDFETLINGNIKKEEPGYITWNEYYLSIPEKLAVREKYENSEKIITCIQLVLEMEGYEDTEEYWTAHNDEIDFYITIIRNIVIAENYDASAFSPDLDKALEKYELLNEKYFDKLLQEEHIAIIGAQLDSFVESEYIEKVGICTYLDRYFESNPDIDKSSPVIQEYMHRLEGYKAELESQEKDYVLRLEENTKQFIGIVGSMAAYSTYAELKPLYDKALAYYYLMNVDSDEAKAAIALFEGYGDALEAVEVNSALFVESSKTLNILDRLGAAYEYSVLSDLSRYYPYLDVTYSDEVKTAMLRYEGLLKAYNDAVASANGAADKAGEVSCSLRSNQISVSILAAVNQLYKIGGGK